MEAKTQNYKKVNMFILFICIFIISSIGTFLWAYSEEGLDIFSHITDVSLILGISLLLSIFITLIVYRLRWAIYFAGIIVGITIIKFLNSFRGAGGEGGSLFYILVIFFEIIFAVIVINVTEFLVRWLNKKFSITF